MKSMKRKIAYLTCITFLFTSLSVGSVSAQAYDGSKEETLVKNVILVVPDGMGLSNMNLGRWYNGGNALTMDSIVCGLVRNYPADNFITDSAASCTAYSSGNKARCGMLGIKTDNESLNMPFIAQTAEADLWKPQVTVLEGAKLAGKATGLVFKSEQVDATPAGFASHTDDRDNKGSIAEQMTYNNVDVVLGAGSDFMVPGKSEDNRKDGEDLIKVLKNRGYDYVTTRTEMLKSTNSKIWGLFNECALRLLAMLWQKKPK